MKKEGFSRIFIVILLFTFSLTFTSAAYTANATNLSAKANYAPGDLFSGTFNLDLKNAPVNLYFEANGKTISVRDFLKANSKPLSCENINCSDVLTLANSGETSKSINLVDNQAQKFAFGINDSGVSLIKLSFNVSSNFPESNELPYEIIIADVVKLEYSKLTDSYTRQVSYGCFDKTLGTYQTVSVDTTGYCEKVNLSKSNKYLVGADISGSGLLFDMDFKLHDGTTFQELGGCTLRKITTDSVSFADSTSCLINTSTMNPAGSYYVCLKGKTDSNGAYQIRTEVSGEKCGYRGSPSGNPVGDYALYAKIPTYAAAQTSSAELNDTGTMSVINNYLSRNYPSGCSNGCIIPISVKGISQSLTISNILVYYESQRGRTSSDKIYTVGGETRRVNYSDLVSLEKLNITANSSGNFSLFLKGEGDAKKLLNFSYKILSLPIIKELYPLTFPAGMDIAFYTQLSNDNNVSTYEWDFGDNTSKITTTVPQAVHKFANISNYTITISVGSGIYSNKASFVVSAQNPKNFLNQTLNVKRQKVLNASKDISTYPSWYQPVLSKNVNIEYYQNELNKLETERTNAYSENDFLNVAAKAYGLVVPWRVYSSEKFTGPFVLDYNKIDPSVIQQIFPSSTESDLAVYRGPIFAWQLDNVEATVKKDKIALVNENAVKSDLVTAYEYTIQSNSGDESYLVIQKPIAEVGLNPSSSGFKQIGTNTYRIVAPNEQFTFSFMVNSSVEPVVYISPKLSLLATEQTIGVCNANAFCEKSLGENYKNCRSDCAPVTPTIIWLIVFFIFALLIYTILQVWYKIKYEEYLFKDRNSLYNLMMFINNAQLNKMSNQQIFDSLISKGWDRDHVKYAMLRANGKNPGMFEIIPIDKVIASIERKKAEKMKDQKIAPPVNPFPQQTPRGPFHPFSSNNPQVNSNAPTSFGQQNKPKN